MALQAFHTRKQGLGFDISTKSENNFSKTQWQVLQKTVNRGKSGAASFPHQKIGE
jgi:hypothetical protein